MDSQEKSRAQLVAEIAKLRNVAQKLQQSQDDHKQTRRNLQESTELYKSLLQHSMDGIYIHDFQGNFIDANPAALQMLGYQKEEISTIKLVSLLDPEQLAQVIQNNIQLIETGTYAGLSEFQLNRKDGTRIWVESKGSVIYRDGEPYCVMGIARDITERKRVTEELEHYRDRLERLVADQTAELRTANEHLRQEIADRERAEEELIKASKLESLGVFAGGIAHDLNNLLTTIVGSISLVKTKIPTEDTSHRVLSSAEKAAFRTKDLTLQLLTFAKGGTPLKRAARVAQLLRENADFVLSGSSLKSVYHFPEGLWNAELDPSQFSQVISNIIINAIQAMPDGGTIEMSAHNHVATVDNPLPCGAGDFVRIEIADNGAGIEQEILAKVFDPYFTTKERGNGLGLAIVYSIVKNHQGHVELQSRVGEGTRISIYLRATTRKASWQQKEIHKNFSGRGKRILVMDDEVLILETVSNMLEQLDFDVALARDGDSALAQYQRAKEDTLPFDIVLMDLTIPGGRGGRSAITQLLQYDAGAKAIVSSGYSDDPIMANFRDYGFFGVLPKPYNFEQLVSVLGNVLED